MSFIASGAGAGNEWRTAPDALNYIDMVRKLQQLADNNNEGVSSNADITAIVLGGTGYAVGDIVRVADGNGDAAGTVAHPSTHAGNTTTFEVTAVSGGVVTALRLRNSGCYSTNPANNGTAGEYDTVAITGTGDDLLTVDLTFSGNGWTIDRVTQEIATAAVGAVAGTGYSAADTIELTEGDSRQGYTAPRAENRSILTLVGLTTGSAMTVTDAGIFHRQPPTNEAVTNVLTGGGDNAMTADLTFQEFTDTTTDIEVMMTGAASSIGIRSFNNGSSIYNLEIAGWQTYEAANDWEAQINKSPGSYPDNSDGSYVITENEAFNYFISITDRRICCVFRLAVGVYANMYLGSFDPYGTALEHPDPTLVIGCSSEKGLNQGSADSRWAGMNLCIASENADPGPGAVLTAAGAWVIVQNGQGNGNNGDIDKTAGYTKALILPGGDFDVFGSKFEDQDEMLGDTGNGNLRERWAHWCLCEDPDGFSGIGALANDYRWITMGNVGEDLPMMFTCTVVDMLSAAPAVVGELDGIKFVDQRVDGGSGFLAAEDEIDDGTDYWYVFSNCRLDRHWTHFTMRGS